MNESFSVKLLDETVKKTCGDCGDLFDAVVFLGTAGDRISPGICEPCRLAREAAYNRTINPRPQSKDFLFRALAKERKFTRYLNFEENKLPSKARASYRSILNTGTGGKGLLCIGPTGRGKTYCAVQLLRGYHAAGGSVFLVDAVDFGLEVANPDSERRERMIRACIAPQWLLFDDLGKAKVTDRVAEAIFHVTKIREDSTGKATIWTANCTGSDLESKLDPEFSGPLIERMKRTTETIIF